MKNQHNSLGRYIGIKQCKYTMQSNDDCDENEKFTEEVMAKWEASWKMVNSTLNCSLYLQAIPEFFWLPLVPYNKKR